MSRAFPESNLFPAVKTWLSRQGYRVFAELWGHDVVAIQGDHVVVVELKMSLTCGLIYQAARATTFANAAYAAVPKMPRRSSLDRCTRHQIGVMLVSDDAVNVIMPPADRSLADYRLRVHRLQCLQSWPDDAGATVGGLPTLAGDGDAQRVLRLVEKYRTEQPKATWSEIFRAVPNHYAHHRSMRQALKMAMNRRSRGTEVLT